MSPEGHLRKLRETEGLIRLVENPGAGTSSSLKLAGFSEHINFHHLCLVPQRKHVYSALPDAKAIANGSLLRIEPNLLRIAIGDDDNDQHHHHDG